MAKTKIRPILENLSLPPNASKTDFYRWCDYIEIRCLTHKDKRFSQDGLVEAMMEANDVHGEPSTDPIDQDEEEHIEQLEEQLIEKIQDKELEEKFVSRANDYFKNLRWRSKTFGKAWPFVLDENAKELKLKSNLTNRQKFYIQLLLSALLSYCPKARWKDLTGRFERISYEVFKGLMPKGSEVYQFGAAQSARYKGHLFDKLTKLTQDIRGHLDLEKDDFKANDAGDSGLDIVAWHPLCDERKGLPIALAQCGCTAEGWPNKMLEASPAKIGSFLHTMHQWDTYYFMPLDLTKDKSGKMEWVNRSDYGKAIVIDRLRFIKLVDLFSLLKNDLFDVLLLKEAISLDLT